ncbi:MAG TPA: response regulator, partial [Sulfuricurvum sp.]|nr:response regulator [Sulfuricurvum sp.]
MENIKLLIVDDVKDNRLVLRAICRKLEGFEIFEAVDGQDAVEQCEIVRPHIILMDIMMPRLDGFQASKLIKVHYPETIIMAVTAMIDPKMEEKMAAIGVAAYIRKPIDKELIRLKLQSYAGALFRGAQDNKLLNSTAAINPFSNEIRNFTITFKIYTIDAIMDFGMWLLVRFDCANVSVCTNIDMIIELLYELLNQEIKNHVRIIITIEESFDEVFIHVPLPKQVKRDQKMDHLIEGLGDMCLIDENMAAFRIRLNMENGKNKGCTVTEVKLACAIIEQDDSVKTVQETRSIGAIDHQVLRESFVHKITAEDYVSSIDGDAFGEVSDLRVAALEWTSWLHTLVDEGTEENFRHFA